MRCPECNVKLHRKRTIENGNTVKRENECPECREKYSTTEYFDTDYNETMRNYADEIVDLERYKRDIKLKYERLTDAIKVILDTVKEPER